MRNGHAARLFGAVLLAALTASCGNTVGPLPRSTLPDVLPSISAADLINAFPSPHDLGSGFTFETNSLGSEDYFVDYSQSAIASRCAYGDPHDSHIPGLSSPRSPMSISGSFDAPDGDAILVMITVDTPAKSADRLALIRRAFANCGPMDLTEDGEGYTESYDLLPAPAAGADEHLAVRLTDTFLSASLASQGPQISEAAFARVGGVVVTINSYGDRAAFRLLPVVTAKVRRVLGI